VLLNSVLGVGRDELRESLLGKPLIRMVVRDQRQFGTDLYFYDTQDAKKVHELLGTASTRGNIPVNQSYASGSSVLD